VSSCRATNANSNDCIAHDRAAGFNTEATLADLEALRAILALEL
jgi:hypothetical protein